MTAIPQGTSVKSLAFRVLQEVAARNSRRMGCPTAASTPGQDAGQDTGALKPQREGVSPCGSPHCAGCYEVGDGKMIHPLKCGEEYRAWLERWKAKGRVQ